MGLGDSRGRGAKSQSTQIFITEDSESQEGYPKVRGVYYYGPRESWVVSFSYKGKRKRIMCGDGYEGYQKAVKLREDFINERNKHDIKSVFK